MLAYIHIRNFVIVEQLEIELSSNMSVLTGETGAGKSILIDALGLVLGDRINGNFVRQNCERAEVVAGFSIQALPAVSEWLRARDLEQDDSECILRRTISADNRSRAYINGRPVPLQDLKILGEYLVDIHGQHAHQSLLKTDIQRSILDDYGDHEETLAQLRGFTAEWQRLMAELESLGGSGSERDAEMELLTYQVQELDKLDLQADEFQQLSEEQRILSHAQQLQQAATQTLNELYEREHGAALSLLEQAASRLGDSAQYDTHLAPVVAQLESISVELREALHDLRNWSEQIEDDPEKTAMVEQRLNEVLTIADKHHVAGTELHELHAQLAARLAALQEGDQRVASLKEQLDSVLQRYHQSADTLHQQRLDSAGRLSRQVSDYIHELGMPNAVFHIAVTDSAVQQPSSHGRDRTEFRFSANPGQVPQPLSKVASGGELSRVSLAIQVVNASGSGVPSLIFDEVDVGISGGIAETVGRHLRELGLHRQVLCITHQPQVASQGKHHLLVSKSLIGQQANTTITRLDDKTRVAEVARMLGGLDITEKTLQHAQEMIASAES